MEETSRLMLRYSKEGGLTCQQAFRIASEAGVDPLQVGKTADSLGIRIVRCQLGLFGYGDPKKVVKPAEEVRPDLEEAIKGSLLQGRLSCKKAWRIASNFGLPRMEISSLCDRMDIKIGPCQLGAF